MPAPIADSDTCPRRGGVDPGPRGAMLAALNRIGLAGFSMLRPGGVGSGAGSGPGSTWSGKAMGSTPTRSDRVGRGSTPPLRYPGRSRVRMRFQGSGRVRVRVSVRVRNGGNGRDSYRGSGRAATEQRSAAEPPRPTDPSTMSM
jgi:hypothetical protein